MTAHSDLPSVSTSLVIHAPVERVWQALFDHHEFGQWFGVELSSPFAAGQTAEGPFTVEVLAGRQLRLHVELVDAPHRFAFSWQPDVVEASVLPGDQATTRVEFHLEPEDAGTRVTVTETGFAGLGPVRRDAARDSHQSGWTHQLGRLRDHVGA